MSHALNRPNFFWLHKKKILKISLQIQNQAFKIFNINTYNRAVQSS